MKNEHFKIHPKLPVIFEAMKNCLCIIDKSYNGVNNKIDSITEAIDSNIRPRDIGIELYMETICLLDFVHRFDQLFDCMPHVNKKEFLDYRLQSSVLKEIRNYLQHMRGDLSGDSLVNYPLLGSIAWVRNQTQYSIALPQKSCNFSIIGIPFDLEYNKFTYNIYYSVKDKGIGLDVAVRDSHLIYKNVCEKFNFSNPAFALLDIEEVHTVKLDLTTKKDQEIGLASNESLHRTIN